MTDLDASVKLGWLLAIAQLRHLYSLMAKGGVRNEAEAAHGILGPSIERLERSAAHVEGLLEERDKLIPKLLRVVLLSGLDQEPHHAQCARLHGQEDESREEQQARPCTCGADELCLLANDALTAAGLDTEAKRIEARWAARDRSVEARP